VNNTRAIKNIRLTACCGRESTKQVCNIDLSTIYSACSRWLRQRGGRKPTKMSKTWKIGAKPTNFT